MLKPRRYKRVVSAGAPAPSGDPYWTSVSLLTNFENNLTFQDGSTNNIALTRNGVVNPSLATPFTGGVGGSEYFNGSTGYVSGTTSTAAEFGTGDFTVEAFVYLTSATTYALLFGSSGLNMYFGIAVYGVAPLYRLTAYDGTTLLEQTAGTSFTLNAWNHVAWVRSGTTFTAYLNGASVYSTTNSKNITGTTGFQVGHSPNYVPYYWAGNISNFRVVKGTAVYTTTFTPPTAPLTAITNTSLLITGTGQGMFDNATFVDQGPNALTVTATGAPVYSGLSPFGNTYAGSVYFGGNGNYLSAPPAAATSFSGAFTMEAWINVSDAGRTIDALKAGTVISGAIAGNTSGQWVFYLIITGGVLASLGLEVAGATVLNVSSLTAALNTWHHVALVRNGTALTIYLNGTSVGSTTYGTTFSTNAGGTVQIARHAFGSPNENWTKGYFSNTRVVNGTAVYTANFTPSTTPLTAITNTSLLVRGDTGAFYDLSNNGNGMTSTGTTTVTTQVKKYGAESASYTATAYQTVADAVNLQLGSGDYTIEAWVYRNAAGVLHSLICKGGATTGWLLQLNALNQLAFSVGATALLTSTTTVGATTWTFVTVTRSGTSTRLFVGGNLEATATDSTNFNQTNALLVGADRSNLNGLNGYLDDIRITKGVARYTANFTPPTATFPTA